MNKQIELSYGRVLRIQDTPRPPDFKNRPWEIMFTMEDSDQSPCNFIWTTEDQLDDIIELLSEVQTEIRKRRRKDWNE